MPLYEYECTTCHRRTEKIQKFSDPEITVCPYCSGDLQRVVSAPAIAFKGGGWYADGYGNAKPKSKPTGDSASSGDSKSSTSDSKSSSAEAKSSNGTSSDSTPAAATPAAAPATASSSSDKK
jgi:putative FmdB family regulatory protein